ncbi:MAG: MBL fold metallo-hydrolase [Gammaproteobacteria bacterium]|nr:MBL fold metallo-hydrolase [Gammaproteobacteria bacterium]
MQTKSWFLALIAISTALAMATSNAQQNRDWNAIQITPHEVSDGLYYLEGAGGHIGLLVGEDGIIMVDDQFAPLSNKIEAAIRAISDQPIRFLINTHIHPDHVGGNMHFGGMGIPIVATDNVYVRLSQRGISKPALPVLTFGDPVTMHLNGQDVRIVPTPPAHTDGDSYVHFLGSDAIHTGDVYRTVAYPRVDDTAGGTFAGSIAALDLLIDMAGPNTKIIPGHGVVSTRDDVIKFRDMALEVRDRVQRLIDDGRTLEQITAARPTADLDEEWGFEPPDLLLPVLFNELTQAN